MRNTLSNPPRKAITRVWQLYETGHIAWIKDALAININGEVDDIYASTVVGCCVIGAIHRVYGRRMVAEHTYHAQHPEPEIIIRKVAMDLNVPCIWEWNDHPNTSRDDVMMLCRRLDI